MVVRGWHESERERPIAKGDLKYIILASIRERPRHGYDVIRLLEDRLGGLYTPSAGAVYPMLRSLEEDGLITGVFRDGRKTYSITDDGAKFLKDHQQLVDEIWARVEGWLDSQSSVELQAIRDDLRTLFRIFGRKANAQSIGTERLERARAIISQAVGDIEAILASGRGLGDGDDRA